MKWSLQNTTSLSDTQKKRLFTKLNTKLNKSGELVIASDLYRDQPRNKQDCISKFQAIIKRALSKPKPRKKTKPTKASKEKRKKTNQKHSEKKRLRSRYRVS